jgi:hypothetical protein
MVLMPFHPSHDPVFQQVRQATTAALPGEAIECFWLKDVRAAGRITDDLVAGLHGAAFCIADVTGDNPNVMWEAGYAMALGKPTLLIGQRVEALPFDLKDHRVLPYRPDALADLAAPLAEAVRQTLARYDLRPARAAPKPVPRAGFAVAVTGSSRADRARLRRRLEVLLGPYLPLRPVWYCGSSGDADEAALAFLLEHGQEAVVVGYHRFDLPEGTRALVAAGQAAFLDASVEALPRGLPGPSARDVLFATRADLVALLWDGASRGTKELVGYFQNQARGLLLGFI